MRRLLAEACVVVYNSNSWPWKKKKTLMAMAMFFIFSSSWPASMIQAVDSSFESVDNNNNGSRAFQWEVLSQRNFSSQIRLHSHLLIVITVPWSGESRSLTKEISQVAANNQEKFASLKLMLLYKNRERILADALGAKDGITILYYHHSLPYSYQGRLRAQNILSSVEFVMSFPPEELPLKLLKTLEDLKSFLESTDKALFLLEFCGWTQRLLAKDMKNGTENSFDGPPGMGLAGELHVSFAAEWKENQKGMVNEKTSCAVQDRASQLLPFWELGYASESYFLDGETRRPGHAVSCSFEEFQQFESFFSGFMTVMRQSFLPPERLRFGLISEASLLSSLGVKDSGSWFLMLYFAGCPNCSKVMKGGDDIKSALQLHSPLVMELEGDGHDPEPALPVDKPSLLCFVDRSSDFPETRRKSKEALNVLRDLAWHYKTSYQMSEKNNIKPEEFLSEAHQASKSASGHRLSKLSLTSQSVILKDKISRIILNKEKHVSLDKIVSDLKGSSLHEILSHVLQQEKETKLSVLAKEAGFQLLSDDLSIKISEALPVQKGKVHSDQVSLGTATHGLLEDIGEKVRIPPSVSKSSVVNEEKSKPVDAEASHTDEGIVDTRTELLVMPDHVHANENFISSEDQKLGRKAISQAEKHQFKGFRGPFFFSDGGYKFLRGLTGGSNIPSVVIIDPISQQHYVLPEEGVFCFSVLSDFIDRFLSGSLVPYQQSVSTVLSPRESPRPPFVNLDFHEMDAIPQVTSRTFSEMVIGVNQSDDSNAGQIMKKDVLVLFSNSWCGFCQKMELVVREIYRTFKHYVSRMKNGPWRQTHVSSDEMEDIGLKLPLIYMMDCTLNDCSMILRSVIQRELYPTLLLFPAGRKDAVTYEGDASVWSVFKFIADHGKNAGSLVHEKGILRAGAEKGMTQNFYIGQPHVVVHRETSLVRDMEGEIPSKSGRPEGVPSCNQVKVRRPIGSQERETPVMAGSVLVATDKLLHAYPFDKSRILIVKAEQGRVFQGLITNKPIGWSSVHGIEEGYYQLLKEAPLSLGGPLPQNGAPLVALARKPLGDQYLQVLPNIYFLDQWATANEIEGLSSRNQSVADYWFFLGYSGWGWDQLFGEIAQGAWDVFSTCNIEELEWPLK